ncbi:MAG: PIN domain-containing protein [Armatimonadetes bacterium]|nr:PIN domain-containing protein [Armatimonadota bacterium]
MTCFVDTSAILILLNRLDPDHKAARKQWAQLLAAEHDLVTTSYVALESFALVQNRLGLDAVRDLHANLMPMVRIHWVNDTLHGAGVGALLSAGKRRLSLVDCVSFEFMRSRGIRHAFVFDDDFENEGFVCLA